MKYSAVPTRKELQEHARMIPEINPSEVLAMLRILQASEEIRTVIDGVLLKEYNLSEGKLRVMIVLHQEPDGVAPSVVAQRTGVTKATISAMMRRMCRDGLVETRSDEADGRAKKIVLTPQGMAFMNAVLPGHYLRISKLMGKLSADEQEELIRLLRKLAGD